MRKEIQDRRAVFNIADKKIEIAKFRATIRAGQPSHLRCRLSDPCRTGSSASGAADKDAGPAGR